MVFCVDHSPARSAAVTCQRQSGWTTSAVTIVSLGFLMAAVIASPMAAAAEGGPASQRLRKLAPSALQGNRESVRKAAKAIVQMGPREFKGSSQMRLQLRAEALRGSSAAANAYGMMLQHGIGGPASARDAPSWYARGSARGNVTASKRGALAYALGWGVRRDTQRASRMLAEVPVDQRVRSMLQISKALLQPGREEPEAAMMWLQKAVALYGGVDPSRVSMRITQLDPSLEMDMKVWLKPLADKGNGAAAMMLASSLSATGNAQDRSESLRLYLLAADKGIDGAYRALGNQIASASKEEAEQAIAVLEKKAEARGSSARLALADYYLYRSAREPDLRRKGLDYLQDAAGDGNAEAQYRMAMTLLSDVEASGERTLAKAYLVLSARGGNRMADIAVAEFGGLPLREAQQIVGVTTR